MKQPLTPEQIEQLENEQVLGKRAKKVYEEYIKEFCQSKREVLFDSFRALPLTASDDLMEVKRMLYAIDTLEAEIVTQIETGKLATITLTDPGPKPENQEVH